jgi:hypothetical protein
MQNQNTNFLIYFIILIKVIFSLFFGSIVVAEENQIGAISEINGSAIIKNKDSEERDTTLFDPIFLNDEIIVQGNSSITLEFDDGTSVILKEFTSYKVTDYINAKSNPSFYSEISSGKVVVETGSIAKNQSGKMELQIKKSSLSLKGTRLNASLNETGQLDVSLGEDNFGNTGLIEMTSDGQKQSIFSTDQVLQVTDQGVSAREKTDVEINEEKSANEVFVKNSSVNEEELEVQLVAKLASGKIQDINNDGIINTSDVDELKQQILNQKQAKIEFIIDNSKEDNTEFLSSVIDQSDEKTTGGVLEKIIDKNDALVENVVEDLVDKNNNFLTTQSSENNSAIKEKVFETIVSKETNNSAAILSKVMAKADTATVSSVINNITEKNENLNSSLSLKVMADFAEKNPLKLENLSENNSDEIQKLTVSAISVAKSNANDANLIAKVVASAPEGLTNKVIEEVTKKSSDADQALSARVMKSVIEINPSKMDVINEENKQTMISQTIEAAKNQINTSNSDENLSVLVAEIIVEADADVATSVLQNLNDSNEEQSSDLTKSIFINLTKNENFEEKLETISENSVIAEDIVDTMVEDAIVATSNSNDTEIIKNLLKENEFMSEKIVEVANKSGNKNLSKIQDIIEEIIEEDPIKSVEIVDNNKEKEIIEAITVTEKPKSTDEITDVFSANVSPN